MRLNMAPLKPVGVCVSALAWFPNCLPMLCRKRPCLTPVDTPSRRPETPWIQAHLLA